MKIPAEYSAIYGGDECGAGVKGMQSPSTQFKAGEFHFPSCSRSSSIRPSAATMFEEQVIDKSSTLHGQFID
jgi:hypothetical protein